MEGQSTVSTRKLGRTLKIHHKLVAKTWQRAGLQPHRFERHMQSDDPDFERKAADVIGLCVNPPDHTAARWRMDFNALLLQARNPKLPSERACEVVATQTKLHVAREPKVVTSLWPNSVHQTALKRS